MTNIILFPERNSLFTRPLIRDDGGSKSGDASLSSVCTSDADEPRPLVGRPDGNVVLRATALCDEIRRSGDAPLPDVAWIIRTAMPRLKRCGRKWSSLPELHRGLLEKHCAAGNPTALMFRGWIEGTHLNGLVHSTGDAQSADVLPSSTEIQRGF